MIKRTSTLLVGIFSILLLLGCQRDDICPEGTQTTPLLMIEFFNAEDPETLRVVENLVVIHGENDTLLGPATTNNIAIPLRTDQSFTEYRFVSNSGTETENSDLLRFSYNASPEYLNRACGFKMNFLNLTYTLDPHSDDPWINSGFVNIEDIENETESHISLTH